VDNDPRPTPPVILIAPNVSERMGGESIKALQIYKSLADRGVEVHQITHSRVRDEIRQNHPGMNVSFVEETRLDGLIWKSKVFTYFSTPYFMLRAARIARELIEDRPGAVVHYTSPISPVVPLFPIPGARVVVGPLNGNIHHPPAFRGRESITDKIRRLFLVPSQWFHRAFFSGKQTADVLLVAGGERTYQALRLAGCRDEQFRPSLDSGVPDSLRDGPPIEHSGANFRFVHHGRLVPYKATDLAIKALARARNPVVLDVIGQGTERAILEKLAAELGVSGRVNFAGWMKHGDLVLALRGYRGMVAPSLAEANGIVFQEAMMIGLPVICVDWGGPSLLVTPESGIAIPPDSEEAVVAGLADAMDRLGEDGEVADSMARAARKEAIDRGFSWSDLIDQWISIYGELAARDGLKAARAASPRA
jgi:glycosyltransferase involved in cell wall biosynthesis